MPQQTRVRAWCGRLRVEFIGTKRSDRVGILSLDRGIIRILMLLLPGAKPHQSCVHLGTPLAPASACDKRAFTPA